MANAIDGFDIHCSDESNGLNCEVDIGGDKAPFKCQSKGKETICAVEGEDGKVQMGFWFGGFLPPA
jgi:hypothetical protein